MKNTFYYQVLISVPSEREAYTILQALLDTRLIAGGMVTHGKSLYRWNGGLEQKTYWNLSAFTMVENKEAIIKETKRFHSDTTPIIAFFKIEEANTEFLEWIETSLKADDRKKRKLTSMLKNGSKGKWLRYLKEDRDE